MDELRTFDIVIAERGLVLRASHDGEALHRLELRSTRVSPVKDRRGMKRPGHRRSQPTCLLEEILRDELHGYFAGKRVPFSVPLAGTTPTPFQRAVWDALLAIPYGETRSYGEIARDIGKPRAARAVGAACGANPWPIIVPCHRVVAANNTLGGYSAGLKWKRVLLGIEGARAVNSSA